MNATASGLRGGPALAAPNTLLVGSAAVGDFNGDGRAEIAVLDNQGNLLIYSVDPGTLQITQAAALQLPATLSNPQAVAGHFRNTANKELAIVALQQINGSRTAVVIPIMFSPGTLNPLAGPAVAVSFSSIDVNAGVAPIRAAVGPLQDALSGIDQLVIGLTSGGTGLIDIVSFDPNSLTPSLVSSTDLGFTGGVVYGVAVGNFDNRDSSGNRLRQLQVAVLADQSGRGDLIIFAVDPSVSFPLSWLVAPSFHDVPSGSGYRLVRGDTQGRSLLLGAPEKVVVTGMIQPDIVIGIPPSHVDWINPIEKLDPGQHPGCDAPPSPCLLNFTVRPSVPATNQTPFATTFTFTDSASNQSNRKSTTSWGLGGKVSAQGKITYGDCDIGRCGSIEVMASASASYDKKVATTNNQYSAQTDQLSLTTGFSDFVFYTAQRMNYYYYPVIGQTVCPASKPNCAASEKVPLYVVFSGADQIIHAGVDGTTQEWYQPAHEPGNAFSYPWAGSAQDPLALLKLQFPNLNLDTQTEPIPNWQATDTNRSNYTKTWAQNTTTGNSTGSTINQTFDSSITVAGTANGLAGSVNGSATVEVNQSFSMKKLNMTTSTLSTTTGITATKPQFDAMVSDSYLYDFAGAIFGLKNLATEQPLQTINLGVDLQTSGPLVVAFLADLTRENAPGWKQAYAGQPDVGLNHPQRWDWTPSTLSVAFNAADLTQDPHTAPVDQPFYHMKGFFITPLDANGQGPNETVVRAGDKLNLQVRVYNYSLTDTNAAGAARVRVRVYGHQYDNNSDTLIGNSFLIGEAQLGSIPGFNSASTQGAQPNWVLASVPFDTGAFAQTQPGNVYLAFWAVVWMEDAKGTLLAEIPDHGLKANPGPMSFASITGVPFEAHSNNVGMYGYKSPLFICPAALPCQTSPSALGGGLGGNERVTVDSVSVKPTPLLLNREAKVTARLRSGNVDGALTIAYYDGDPKRGGKLFDAHHISHIRSNDTYMSKAAYRPQTCGAHTLYVVSRPESAAPETNHVSANVTLEPVSAVQALIDATIRVDTSRRQEGVVA